MSSRRSDVRIVTDYDYVGGERDVVIGHTYASGLVFLQTNERNKHGAYTASAAIHFRPKQAREVAQAILDHADVLEGVVKAQPVEESSEEPHVLRTELPPVDQLPLFYIKAMMEYANEALFGVNSDDDYDHDPNF